MRYHLFLNFYGMTVKIAKTFLWKLAVTFQSHTTVHEVFPWKFSNLPVNTWRVDYYRLMIKLITMEEYYASGEDILGNTIWVLRDLGSIPSWSPEATGRRGRWYWPPISKDEDGITQYVRARCMAFTLLLSKLKPHTQIIWINSKILRILQVTCITHCYSVN